MTALERTPMTNDAERVSDIVAVAWRWRWGRIGNTAWHLSLEKPGPFAEDGYEIEPLYTADIIEAQSKALAEAREALSYIAHGPMADYRKFALAALIGTATPTPENPNG